MLKLKIITANNVLHFEECINMFFRELKDYGHQYVSMKFNSVVDKTNSLFLIALITYEVHTKKISKVKD